MSEMKRKKKDPYDVFLENSSLEEPNYKYIGDILKQNKIKETKNSRKKKISWNVWSFI